MKNVLRYIGRGFVICLLGALVMLSLSGSIFLAWKIGAAVAWGAVGLAIAAMGCLVTVLWLMGIIGYCYKMWIDSRILLENVHTYNPELYQEILEKYDTGAK